MSEARGVTVVIPSWNGRAVLGACLAALAEQRDPGVPWSTVVLDNGSTDGTADWIAEAHPDVRVLSSPTNLGFAAAINRLVEESPTELVALLNNDARPEPGWLAALVSGLTDAPDEVAAVSGKTIDWAGERLDCAQAVMTFDGHAFQRDRGRPLARARIPEDGAELLVPNGGNMILRRRTFLDVGAFDPTYFAYLEDVDLGWRTWARGRTVRFAAGAVTHHRASATSERFGNAKRGFLFERNAFLNVHKNYEDGLWQQLMPAVLLVLCSRVQHLLVHDNPAGDVLARDPFGSAGRTRSATSRGSGLPSADRIAAVLRDQGPGGLLRKTVEKVQVEAARARAAAVAADPEIPRIADPRTLAHLQAVSFVLGHLDEAASARAAAQAARTRADREIFERFPLHLVPTYPGDEALFASAGFEAWLPRDVPIVRASIEDVMEPSG